MTALLAATRAVALATIAVLAIVVLIGLLTGSIRSAGLLSIRTRSGASVVSPMRVQLLLVSLAGAVYYAQLVILTHDPTRMPDPPTIWLSALGASNGVYVLGRTGTRLLDLVRQFRRPSTKDTT